MRISTASAIDLAGSEDNRRTDNGKERMVESASINKSLFVLASCVEAIGRKASRIPYRESKMTRILSLGQNNGLTIMILNLAPVRSYHLDTLSSLNFANRTKKIEVNEVENQPVYRPKSVTEAHSGTSLPAMNRQPLRPKNFSANVVPIKDAAAAAKADKPVKQFSVYADKSKPPTRPTHLAGQGYPRAEKRTSSEAIPTLGRPSKTMRAADTKNGATHSAAPGLTKESIEEMIERKVAEKLAAAALDRELPASSTKAISDEVQARLDALERRVEGQETERAEGLQYLLMAKQHQVRGEDASALKMYQLALPFFPGNEKLNRKMLNLQEKIKRKKEEKRSSSLMGGVALSTADATMEQGEKPRERRRRAQDEYDDYQDEPQQEDEEDDTSGFQYRTKARKPARHNLRVFRDEPSAQAENEELGAEPVQYTQHAASDSEDELAHALSISVDPEQTPRTKQLLRIINTRDVSQIRLLKGVGAKKAEAIVNCLCSLDDGREEMDEEADGRGRLRMVRDLGELGRLKGVGLKGVEKMREGLAVAA